MSAKTIRFDFRLLGETSEKLLTSCEPWVVTPGAVERWVGAGGVDVEVGKFGERPVSLVQLQNAQTCLVVGLVDEVVVGHVLVVVARRFRRFVNVNQICVLEISNVEHASDGVSGDETDVCKKEKR